MAMIRFESETAYLDCFDASRRLQDAIAEIEDVGSPRLVAIDSFMADVFAAHQPETIAAYPVEIEFPDELAGVAGEVLDELDQAGILDGIDRTHKGVTLAGREGESIYDYFARKLGRAPQDATLKELPVQSGCGVDCKAAIDGAAALMRASAMAIGSTRAPAIREIAEETVRVFWHG